LGWVHFVDAKSPRVEVGRKVGHNTLDKASSYWSWHPATRSQPAGVDQILG
jgi:hypothetical protein